MNEIIPSSAATFSKSLKERKASNSTDSACSSTQVTKNRCDDNVVQCYREDQKKAYLREVAKRQQCFTATFGPSEQAQTQKL